MDVKRYCCKKGGNVVIQSLEGINLGVAICGSFGTFKNTIEMIKQFIELGVNVYPIMSYTAYENTTRFGLREEFIEQIENVTKNQIVHTTEGVETWDCMVTLDAILIAPCTGNTLAKLANDITDTPVTLVTKAMLKNSKPVVIAVATNDRLGSNLKNIGTMIKNQNVYFVPFNQSDPQSKPYALVANFLLAPDSVLAAVNQKQIQPIIST